MANSQATERRRALSLLSKSNRTRGVRSGSEGPTFFNGTVDSLNPNNLMRADSMRKATVLSNATNSTDAGPSNADQGTSNAEEEAKLRGELRYYFMTPCEKWRYRRKVPINLCVQIIKVLLVTTLVIFFGNYRAAYVSYLSTLRVSLEHLYLYKWNPTLETPPYPPSSGPFAVYTKQDFYDSIDYTMQQYNETQTLETDTFQLFREPNSAVIVPPRLCVTQDKEMQATAWNRSIRANFDTVVWCVDVLPVNKSDNSTDQVFDIVRFLQIVRNSTGLQFEAIDYLRIYFAFVSVKPPAVEFAYWATDCYQLNITITYDNTFRSGQIPISLDLRVQVIKCNATTDETYHSINPTQHVLSALVIAFCILSLILSLRSLRRGYKMMRKTARHFESVLGQALVFADSFEFVNLWFVLVVCGDALCISSAVMKLLIDMHVAYNYDLCSAFLGIATLFVWVGVLRYLIYFAGYSDLILTMKQAGPNMVRYLLCALTMFLGFLFCGWVVIGPYHVKMRTLSSTAECLFSLVNGDDMFATFSNLSQDVASPYMNVFLRVYLYCFIAMFIYMVIAVFLSVILDVYDTVKQTGMSTLRQTKAESSDLFKFIYRLDDDDSIAIKQRENRSRNNSLARINLSDGRSRGCLLSRCCCCCTPTNQVDV